MMRFQLLFILGDPIWVLGSNAMTPLLKVVPRV
jgi:hypothetical protein